MPRRTSPLTPLLVPLLAVVLLSGCSEEAPEPKFAETPTAEPTPVEQEETAEEFIRRWNDATNKMMAGDSQQYRLLSANCPQCITTADRIDEYYSDGGGVEGSPRRVVAVERSPRFADQPHMYSVKFKSLPSTVSEGSQGPEQSYPGGVFYNDVLLSPAGNTWQVLSYSQVVE